MILRKDNKFIFITLISMAVVFVLFFTFFFRVYDARNDTAKEERRKIDYELEPYYGGGLGRSGLVDMQDYYRELLALKESKRKNVEDLKLKLEIKPTPEFVADREEKNPGAYFKKILDRKRTELLMESSRRNIEIPESLGFGEEIPPDDTAADLLRFLYIKDQLIRIGLESGIVSVTSIKHSEKVKTGPDKDAMFINEFPVRMTVQGNLKSIMRILYRMRSRNRFLILRNLEIVSENENPDDGEQVLGVGFSVAGMTFSQIDNVAETEGVKKKPEIQTGVHMGF